MAETTVKQRAFAFIAFHFQRIGLSRFVYVGAIFSAVTTCRDSTWLWSPGGEVGTVAFKQQKLVNWGNQRMSLQKCVNFSDCGPISACATDTRTKPEYPVLFSMFSGEFCLRLKPYLVVKIASDVLTVHCCQVCVLAMMFCRSDCRRCAGMCGKW